MLRIKLNIVIVVNLVNLEIFRIYFMQHNKLAESGLFLLWGEHFIYL
jgi:hypothetical protein